MHAPGVESSTTRILRLQRLAGNRAVASLLAPDRVGSRAGPVVAREAAGGLGGPSLPSLTPQIQAPKPDRPGTKVVGTDTKERARTLVQVRVIGHASPRWRGSRGDTEADQRNAALSEARAQAVREAVERHVRDSLAGREVDIRYDYSVADPRAEPGGVVLGTESRGSRETLGEAGKRGRAANDSEMRRVDVIVDLTAYRDTTVFTEHEDTVRRSAATRDWSIKVGFSVGAQAVGGIQYFYFHLRNKLTDKTMYGHGYVGKLGGAVEFSLGASVSWGDATDFTTKSPVNFSDFEGAQVQTTSAGLSLGIIGYESATMQFNVGGGWSSSIDTGGWNSGTAGIDIGSTGLGLVGIQGDTTPYDTRLVKKRRTTTKESGSKWSEGHRHRVMFPTGEAVVTPGQREKLAAYVRKAVANYEAEDWRGPLATTP